LREVFSAASCGVPIRYVIYGMPGLGKTSYAVEAYDQGLYSQVFWSSGTTVDKLNEGIAKILDLLGHPDRFKMEQGAKLTVARIWLESAHCNETVRSLLAISKDL
jgi:hypothetical protein